MYHLVCMTFIYSRSQVTYITIFWLQLRIEPTNFWFQYHYLITLNYLLCYLMIFYIKSCFIGWFTGQVIPKYSLVLTTYVEICPRYISTHNLGSTCHFFILKVCILWSITYLKGMIRLYQKLQSKTIILVSNRLTDTLQGNLCTVKPVLNPTNMSFFLFLLAIQHAFTLVNHVLARNTISDHWLLNMCRLQYILPVRITRLVPTTFWFKI